MTEPEEPTTPEPAEPSTLIGATFTASGTVGPGPGQTEEDVPAQAPQDEE